MNDFPLKHGKLGKFLHQENNVSVTTSSRNFSKKDAKLRNIIVEICVKMPDEKVVRCFQPEKFFSGRHSTKKEKAKTKIRTGTETNPKCQKIIKK